MSTIDQAIGDGLGRTRDFLSHSVIPRFPGLSAFAGEDSATLDWPAGHVVCTSDSFIVDPVVFPGGDLGVLAVAGVVNDLLCSGGWPAVLMLNLVLGPAATPDLVDRILGSVARTASAVGCRVVGGDTKFLPDAPRLVMAVAAFGLGQLRWRDRPYSLADARPGDQIICTGSVGDHSIAVLSAREGLGFERVVRSDCAPLTGIVQAVMTAHGDAVVGLRDLTRGGLGGALFELAGACGFPVALLAGTVPVAPPVQAASEMLGLDPLFLTNEGRMIIVARADRADQVVRTLRRTAPDDAAVIVGTVLDRPPGGPLDPGVVVRHASGWDEPLDEPSGIPVPRLC